MGSTDEPGTTTDPTDPRLKKGGPDEAPVPQQSVYLVLSAEERAKGFVRPVRRTYTHLNCGHSTTMSQAIAETYARSPGFYQGTYCVNCRKHLPVSEFVWEPDGSRVGS